MTLCQGGRLPNFHRVPKVAKFLTMFHLTTRTNASPWSIPYSSSNPNAMKQAFNLLPCPSNPSLLFNYIHLLEISFLPKGKSTRVHVLFLVTNSISYDIASCHVECSFASSNVIGSNIFMTLQEIIVFQTVQLDQSICIEQKDVHFN